MSLISNITFFYITESFLTTYMFNNLPLKTFLSLNINGYELRSYDLSKISIKYNLIFYIMANKKNVSFFNLLIFIMLKNNWLEN